MIKIQDIAKDEARDPSRKDERSLLHSTNLAGLLNSVT